MGHGDKYILDEGTSIWDSGSVATSGVDVGSPGWHWDPGGAFHCVPEVQDDYGGMDGIMTKHTHSFMEFRSTLVASWFER